MTAAVDTFKLPLVPIQSFLKLPEACEKAISFLKEYHVRYPKLRIVAVFDIDDTLINDNNEINVHVLKILQCVKKELDGFVGIVTAREHDDEVYQSTMAQLLGLADLKYERDYDILLCCPKKLRNNYVDISRFKEWARRTIAEKTKSVITITVGDSLGDLICLKEDADIYNFDIYVGGPKVVICRLRGTTALMGLKLVRAL